MKPSQFKRMTSDRPHLTVDPELAVLLGLEESIVLRQLHYWLLIAERHPNNLKDGKYWCYNTFEQWRANFPFWSEKTVKRIFGKLVDSGLVFSENLNENKHDQTRWYTIDYAKYIAIMDGSSDLSREGQIDPMQKDKLTRSIRTICPYPEGQIDPMYRVTETTTETNTENKENIKEKFNINSYLKNSGLDPAVNSLLETWAQQRKVKITQGALELALKMLKKHSTPIQIQMVENSVMAGWQGIFELKTQQQNSYSKPNTGDNWKPKGKHDDPSIYRGIGRKIEAAPFVVT